MAYRSSRTVRGVNGQSLTFHVVDGVADLPAIGTQQVGNRAYGILGGDDGSVWEAQKGSGGLAWVQVVSAAGANLVASGNVTAGANVIAGGDVSVGDDLTVAGDAIVTGDVSVGDDLTVADDAAVTGDMTVGGGLSVTGDVSAVVVRAADVVMLKYVDATHYCSLTATAPTGINTVTHPDRSGTVVLGPEAAEANLSAAVAGDFAALEAATDAASRAEVVTALNLVITKVNNLLAKLRTAGALAP